MTAFHRHGAAAAVRLARESAQVVEDSGDLVLLTLFLAQLSFVELYAEGVTPGVLERALELEQLVGPLPTETMTPTFVEGLRLMCATSTRLRARLSRRAHGDRRGSRRRPRTGSCPPLAHRARVPRRGVEPRRRIRRGDWPRKASRGPASSGSVAWSMPTSAASTKLAHGRPRDSRSRASTALRAWSSGTLPCSA